MPLGAYYTGKAPFMFTNSYRERNPTIETYVATTSLAIPAAMFGAVVAPIAIPIAMPLYWMHNKY